MGCISVAVVFPGGMKGSVWCDNTGKESVWASAC